LTTGKRIRHPEAARRRRSRHLKTAKQEPPDKVEGVAATVGVESAARILGKSRRMVQYMLRNGRLGGTRTTPRGWWRVSKASIGELMAKLDAARAAKTAALGSRKKNRRAAAQRTNAGPATDGAS
jgi:hypothetical protein